MRLRHRIKAWILRHRADRQMPPPIGSWLPGPPLTLDTLAIPFTHTYAIGEALEMWSEVLGMCPTVPGAGITLDPPYRSIRVLSREPLKVADATTQMRFLASSPGKFHSGEIRLRPSLPVDDRLIYVYAHELGHALCGLGDRVPGDPRLLMTRDRGHGFELLDKEKSWSRSQWR